MLYLGEYQRTMTSHGKIRIPSKWLKGNSLAGVAVPKHFIALKSDGLIARFIEHTDKISEQCANMSDCDMAAILNLDPEHEQIAAVNVNCTTYGWIQLPEELLQILSEQTMYNKQIVHVIGVGNGFDILTKEQYDSLYQESSFENLVDTLKFMKF